MKKKPVFKIIAVSFLAVVSSCDKSEPGPNTGCFIRYTNDNREYAYGCGTREDFQNNSDFTGYTYPEKDEGGRYIFWSSSTNFIEANNCPECDQYKSILQSTSKKKPPSRMYHDLIFHPETETILLIGGQTVPAFATDLQDVWVYWLEDNYWEPIGIYEAVKSLTTGAMSPAYDEESNRVIVLNAQGETWSFHMEELDWEVMKPSKAPSQRVGHMMAYDPNSDRIILFGGFEGKSLYTEIYDDTWAYDFNSDTWTEMNPAVNPPPRIYAEMIFNSHSNKVVLWGGSNWERLDDNAIWEYDFIQDSWEEIETEGGPDLPFPYFGMIYDDQNDAMFLFGGPSDTGKLVHWKYSFADNQWSLLDIENGPPYLLKHSIVLHPLLRKAVLFSGVLNENPFTLSGSTWVFDLETLTWEEI
jgi:hypothetical protein